MNIYFFIIYGLSLLLSFFAGAWVYHRGQAHSPILPELNLDKKEIERQPEWDQV
jgi:hypothetical protein